MNAVDVTRKNTKNERNIFGFPDEIDPDSFEQKNNQKIIKIN